MPKSVYIDLYDIWDTVNNKLQIQIMGFVEKWAKERKTPIPQKEIIKKMKEEGIKESTVVNSLNILLRKRYLRRAYMITNKTYYVQLRRI